MNNRRTLIYPRLLVSRSTILLFMAIAISATSIQNFRLIYITTQDDVGSVLQMSIGAAIQVPSNITSISSAVDREEQIHSSRRVWIDVAHYAEGIAGWTTSLVELLHIAQVLNGSLIEPCVSNGRLASCLHYEVPVSEIFDLSDIRKTYDDESQPPLMVSYDYYRAHTNINNSTKDVHYNICVSALSRNRCSNETKTLEETNKVNFRADFVDTNRDDLHLHLDDYWRSSAKLLENLFGRRLLLSQGDEEQLLFHPQHIKIVDDMLLNANIDIYNFTAIHWRAEKKGMDFLKCSRAVLDAKHAIINGGGGNHSFILLSSLNANPNMMWKGSKLVTGSRGRSKAQQALDFLVRENDFTKVDDLLKKSNASIDELDSGMLAVYDLILASKSMNFATCARGGGHGCTNEARRVCEECNHVGKFGKLALSFRSDNEKGSSWACWPATSLDKSSFIGNVTAWRLFF